MGVAKLIHLGGGHDANDDLGFCYWAEDHDAHVGHGFPGPKVSRSHLSHSGALAACIVNGEGIIPHGDALARLEPVRETLPMSRPSLPACAYDVFRYLISWLGFQLTGLAVAPGRRRRIRD